MIDIHAHILPGLDDGAADIEEAVEMARIAQRSGISAMIATPHCNLPGTYDNYFGKSYIDSYNQTVEAVKKAGLSVQILPGMEAFGTYDLPDLIVEKKIMPLNQSRYILIEFAFDENPDYVADVLRRVKAVGAKPVIAHPERYEFVQDNPLITREWNNLGCSFQINKSSFVGRFGQRVLNTAFDLLNMGVVTVVASDAHGVEVRTPSLHDAYDVLRKTCSDYELAILFHDNPLRICENKQVMKKRV